MISNTVRTRIIRLKRQKGFHEHRIEVGDLDERKTKLTKETVAALRWTLQHTYERISQTEKSQIKDPIIDRLVNMLRKLKYIRHKAQYDAVDMEILELHNLDAEPLRPQSMRISEH